MSIGGIATALAQIGEAVKPNALEGIKIWPSSQEFEKTKARILDVRNANGGGQ